MNRFHRVIATFLLGAYALTGTAVIPALASFLAYLDGSHTVKVNISATGIHLSLQHQTDNFTPASTDHHSAAGRLVTHFCKHSPTGNHELDSSCVSPAVSLERDLKENVDQAPLPSLNHNASMILSIVTDRLDQALSSSGLTLATSRHPMLPSQWPMMATVQLLL